MIDCILFFRVPNPKNTGNIICDKNHRQIYNCQRRIRNPLKHLRGSALKPITGFESVLVLTKN